ncbi:histidine phosphatase family protein [Companilactobacillus sp.]|uniref:histidine phosphatase family protein n=1 Tax=Companilactobacillus sp. TaxID=2767905 RepID=UPI0025BDD56C|nr:histidine phosphatase family protein [Companilactobacillus sp.]MCH4009091.1 histidine phosphatase family protein [Companilactobacillus sp.]MCH4050730.1 histidine phosphatase family protein [Companilactobacillus sp.]MCH4077033.1 histidine phosphatase family protein [Companilactobacillus sp.]MCH4125609.1 histidine phosphatase family protein [Companilactobacillus sp.]MCI1311318.1 histidine phosphatase family protein [Companilactobacillus sp.]
MAELYVVRHGETDTNKEMRINGRSTNMPLNEKGIQQAENLAKEIDMSSFDVVYTSPMTRALQTAEILNKGVHDELIQDDRLYEADYGSWDGVSEDELEKKYPQTFDENGFLLPSYINYAENAEDYEHVYQRVESFLQDVTKLGDKKVMAVCHGFISRAIFKQVTGISDISKVVQSANAGISKYQLTEKNRYLRFYARKKI